MGIPTVSDRIAQQVVKTYLEPRLESVFVDNSYGYRPNKNAHTAIQSVQQNVRRYSWVIDLDIQEFFENVNHELLLKALERHVSEKWVLLYIKRWLEAPVILEDGAVKVSTGKVLLREG
ncbi:reverse transcriptase domain-containing protein [Algoriphagus sp. NBT04N3]|uniref:reverse transcriptase domain-containing protein n=1 Tax=Algoriphagus sp. NBT04N3 TaxID=2705473 RepID=UPI00210360AF|nr:reverse transcriptase domain-containing protein [Algoriphagus sp. NBT04N3]